MALSLMSGTSVSGSRSINRSQAYAATNPRERKNRPDRTPPGAPGRPAVLLAAALADKLIGVSLPAGLIVG